MFEVSPSVPATPAPTTLRAVVARYSAQLDEAVIALADRVHAAGDDLARREGWTVRRVGLTGRAYRSPLFDGRSAR